MLRPDLSGTPPGQVEEQESDACASEIQFCDLVQAARAGDFSLVVRRRQREARRAPTSRLGTAERNAIATNDDGVVQPAAARRTSNGRPGSALRIPGHRQA